MITSILNRKTCTECLICCRYTDEDVWDAPGFTKEELNRVLKLGKHPYHISDNLYYLVMDKRQNGEYICPLLTEKGCKLNTDKPFKCAIWPLYVVTFQDRIALAVSDVCPSVFAITNEEILTGLHEVMDTIKSIIYENPQLIEPFKENFRFIVYLDE